MKRRKFLQAAGASGLAGILASHRAPVFAQANTVHILRWNDFVPAADKVLREVFAQTGANSQVLKTDGEDMQNREHSCFFSAEHAAKDSRIAHELALAAGLNLPLAKATREQYERMVALGLGQLDKSGIAELTFPGRHA